MLLALLSGARGNNLKGFKDFYLKPGPESGLDYLICAEFAGSRAPSSSSSSRVCSTQVDYAPGRHGEKGESRICDIYL